MKQIIAIIALAVFSCVCSYANVLADCKAADRLHKEFKYDDENKLLVALLDQAKTPKEESEVNWRLSRVTLYLGDDAEDRASGRRSSSSTTRKARGLPIRRLRVPEQCPRLLLESLEHGTLGPGEGILDSLGKAEPMQKLLIQAIEIDSEHADSFYVLGELYDELPGWPLSFGNIDFSISFARKSISINEKQVQFGTADRKLTYYIKLAKHLWKRNASASKRQADQKSKHDNYETKKSILEKNDTSKVRSTYSLGRTGKKLDRSSLRIQGARRYQIEK